MIKASFDIFVPDGKKFHLTPNWIMTALWAVAILIMWPLDGFFKVYDTLQTMFVVVVFLLSLYYLVASLFKHEALNGTIEGKLEFDDYHMIIDGEVLELKNIDSINFVINDYYNQLKSITRSSFNPRLSLGVGNGVTYSANGESWMVYFQILNQNDGRDLYPFMKKAIRLGKMKQGFWGWTMDLNAPD